MIIKSNRGLEVQRIQLKIIQEIDGDKNITLDKRKKNKYNYMYVEIKNLFDKHSATHDCYLRE